MDPAGVPRLPPERDRARRQLRSVGAKTSDGASRRKQTQDCRKFRRAARTEDVGGKLIISIEVTVMAVMPQSNDFYLKQF